MTSRTGERPARSGNNAKAVKVAKAESVAQEAEGDHSELARPLSSEQVAKVLTKAAMPIPSSGCAPSVRPVRLECLATAPRGLGVALRSGRTQAGEQHVELGVTAEYVYGGTLDVNKHRGLQGITSFQPGPGSNAVIFAPIAVEFLPRSFS